MNIAGKITTAQFRDIVLASWRLGRMDRDLRAADMVKEIKRRLLAELQTNAPGATAEAGPCAENTGDERDAGPCAENAEDERDAGCPDKARSGEPSASEAIAGNRDSTAAAFISAPASVRPDSVADNPAKSRRTDSPASTPHAGKSPSAPSTERTAGAQDAGRRLV